MTPEQPTIQVAEGRLAALLDASAVLAWLQQESGWERLDPIIGSASIGAANWSEVLQKSWQHGQEGDEVAAGLLGLGLEVEPVTEEDGVEGARLWSTCPDLSLGDRLCLAIGRRLNYTVWTADRTWKGRRLGIMIQAIR